MLYRQAANLLILLRFAIVPLFMYSLFGAAMGPENGFSYAVPHRSP